MRLLFSIIFTITALSGCAKKGDDNNTPVTIDMNNKDTTTVAADSLSYLALGDSYTIGEAVPASESFPHQLSIGLTLQKHPIKTPKIIAVTGWTTDNLISAIDRSGLTGKKYDFVTLLIGVNDQFQHVSQDNYKIKFAQVLNTAITFANGDKTRVFVLSIPDYGVTPFAGGNEASIGPEIDQFNAINKDISTKAGVNYLDITGISRQAATDPSLIANDGLHPSPKMYQLWVEQLLPMITAKLKVN
ncbi:MAG TPA: SGNH/GDSL hydrolase family protein [Mucilaginibacter sp.]|nr:SGNH/GDSL hydrolase family protein [Mucilaginibacter sp.]